MKNATIQWWVIGSCSFDYEAHRCVYLAKAWAKNDEVRYVHPMELTTLVRSKFDKNNFQRPSDFGLWLQKGEKLSHLSRIGFYIPSLSRRWRMPGKWWTNKWPFGCWLMPGSWWISEWLFGRWLAREMSRLKQPGISQVIVNFCWKLSWSLRMTPADLLIYDCADNFRNFSGETTERVDWAEGRLARLADAVVISSLSFASRIQSHNPAMLHIPNGVSQELLDNLAPVAPVKYTSTIDKPVIIYHGITHALRFNWDLFLAVAGLCPDCEFRVYTNSEQVSLRLTVPANVRVIDWVSTLELPEVLNQCALGFMPYELKEPTLSGFPLKMFEYLAAGLPVVSTRLREVERFAEHVVLCGNDPQHTAALIRRAIDGDSDELRIRRRSLAEKYSWHVLAGQYRDYVLAQSTA